MESSLGDSFQSLYRNNSLKLEEIRRISMVLQELVSHAQDFGEKANMNLTKALETATQAKNVSGQRRREAQSARDSAANAHSDTMQVNREADSALNTAMEFKVSLLLRRLSLKVKLICQHTLALTDSSLTYTRMPA